MKKKLIKRGWQIKFFFLLPFTWHGRRPRLSLVMACTWETQTCKKESFKDFMSHDHLPLYTEYCQVAQCDWGSSGEKVWLGTKKAQEPQLNLQGCPSRGPSSHHYLLPAPPNSFIPQLFSRDHWWVTNSWTQRPRDITDSNCNSHML